MQVENLKEGKVVKNYKDLCNILGCDIKKGNSKKAHMKELQRYIRIDIIGQAIYIKEIYKEAKPSEDKRKNNKGANNNKYSKDMENILLYLCKEVNENKDYSKIELSVTGMLSKMGIINDNYNVGRYNMGKLSNYTEIPIATIRDFYNNTTSNFCDSIERTLKKLQNRCLIKWSYIYKIQNEALVYKEADEFDMKNITISEKKVLTEMGYSTKSQVISAGKYNSFYKNVLKELKNCNILKYYKAFKIFTTEEFEEMVESNLISFLHDNEFVNSKLSLNETIRNNVSKNALNRQQKTIKANEGKYLMDSSIKEKDKVRLLADFIDDIDKLSDISLNVSTKIKLEEELKKVKNTAYTIEERLWNSDWDKLYICNNIINDKMLEKLF